MNTQETGCVRGWPSDTSKVGMSKYLWDEHQLQSVVVAKGVIMCLPGQLGVTVRNKSGSDTDTILSALIMSVSHGVRMMK